MRENNPKYITVTKVDDISISNFAKAMNEINIMELVDTNLTSNPNDTYAIIESKINEAKDIHLPTTTVKFNKYKHKKSPWITLGILQSIKYRDKLYSKLKRCKPDSLDYSNEKYNLNTYNKILNSLIKEAKQKYYEHEFIKHSSDLRKTWDTINKMICRNNKSKEFPSYIISKSKKIENTTEAVNVLNEYFSNIGTFLASSIPNSEKDFSEYLKQNINCSFSFQTVNETDIMKILDKFKPKTSSGPDGLSMKLLKSIKDAIAAPLSILVNQSLYTGIFPTDFKLAKVLPILKKPNDYNVENFRPISLLNSVSKILEKCVFNQMYAYFESNNLLFTSQYGYRKEHSTELACLELVDKVSHQLDEKHTPICVFLDLSKAFDTLNHEILLSKLKHYGLSDTPLRWFNDYLSHRHQYIEVNDIRSKTSKISMGVPQGSILGPLLFIIYMNDINYASELFQAILYADDTSLNTTISAVGKSSDSLNSNAINHELSLISQWLACNKLSLNVKKNEIHDL